VSVYWATNDWRNQCGGLAGDRRRDEPGAPGRGRDGYQHGFPTYPGHGLLLQFHGGQREWDRVGKRREFSVVLDAGPPTVNSAGGATAITLTTATLNGNLTAGVTGHVYVLWAPDPGNLANTNDLGVRAMGAFSTNITGLPQDTVYYYRCYATNDYGDCLAPLTSFNSQGITWDGGGDGTTWSNPPTGAGTRSPALRTTLCSIAARRRSRSGRM